MNIDWELEFWQLVRELDLGLATIHAPRFVNGIFDLPEGHVIRITIPQFIGSRFKHEFIYNQIVRFNNTERYYRQIMCQEAVQYLRKRYVDILRNDYVHDLGLD